MKNKKISIILPIFNEGENIKDLIFKIKEDVKKNSDITYEIILIDDGSKDNSWELIKSLAKEDKNIKAIKFSRNFGKEYAIMAGLEHSKGDAVIVMDADGQHPPELITEMIKIWENEGTEIVEGVKKEREREGILKRMGAYFFYKILKILSGFDLEGKSDFKLLDRKVVDYLLNLKERSLFFRGVTEWLGFKKNQIPFIPLERKQGKTKWSFIKILRYAIDNITSFSSTPLHFVTIAGLIFLFFSIFLGIQTLFMKFTGKAVSGFTTVILLLLIIGSLLMISLGIIGEYIAKIYEEIKARPRYIVEEMLNFER